MTQSLISLYRCLGRLSLFSSWYHVTKLKHARAGSFRVVTVVCRQAVNNTMQKFGLKTTKSKRARREAEAEEEAEATLQFKVSVYHR